jgi:hypothetical protein
MKNREKTVQTGETRRPTEPVRVSANRWVYKKPDFSIFSPKISDRDLNFISLSQIPLLLLAIKLERRVFMDSKNYPHYKIQTFSQNIDPMSDERVHFTTFLEFDFY